MDKYKRLLSNTLIFAIGTFSSKVLVFLLVPFYTNLLTKGEMGTADLIDQRLPSGVHRAEGLL